MCQSRARAGEITTEKDWENIVPDVVAKACLVLVCLLDCLVETPFS